ncbi:MAG: hypothetical protein IKX16_06180, partial [Clostridia bacterium]|nr:hypothetical protein [Clostridia bacterium]
DLMFSLEAFFLCSPAFFMLLLYHISLAFSRFLCEKRPLTWVCQRSEAIGEYLDRLSYNGRFDFTLDDIRALFREEIRELDIAPREAAPAFTPPAEMTEEQRQENDRNVLETLDMFT